MNKIASKVQRLSQRAAEVRQAMASVPPMLTDMREAIATTTGHVQKLRADMATSVGTLRAETDAQLVETMREIDASAEVLAEVGCRLGGVDMDLGPVRRLVVNIERVEAVDAAELRAVFRATSERRVVQALLAALMKADELASKVQLTHLSYRWLRVEIGLVPSVRMSWRPDVGEEEEEELAGAKSEEAAARSAAGPKGATSEGPGNATAQPAVAVPALAFGQSSFFARAADAVPAAEQGVVAAAASGAGETSGASGMSVVGAPSVTTPTTSGGGPAMTTPRPALTADWRVGALDRFKKMPDLGRKSGG